jgi:hypothetical protein
LEFFSFNLLPTVPGSGKLPQGKNNCLFFNPENNIFIAAVCLSNIFKFKILGLNLAKNNCANYFCKTSFSLAVI